MNSSATRFAEAADIEAIVALVNAAFRPGRFFANGDRTNSREVAALLRKGKFILLFEGEGLAGCVYAALRGGWLLRIAGDRP